MLKRISGIAFAIAFLMGIVLFTGTGSEYIPKTVARSIFMIAGGIAILLNLLNFQDSKHNPFFSFVYWAGNIITFVGLVFFIMHWPFAKIIFIAGMILTGVSFFIPSQTNQEKRTDLLDDF